MTNYDKIFYEFGEALYWEGVNEGDTCKLREYFHWPIPGKDYKFVAVEELHTASITLLILIIGDAVRCGYELMRDGSEEREYFNGSTQEGRWDCFEKYNEIVKRLKGEEDN